MGGTEEGERRLIRVGVWGSQGMRLPHRPEGRPRNDGGAGPLLRVV